jgi:hypothetical protein
MPKASAFARSVRLTRRSALREPILYTARAVLLLVPWNRHLILTFSGDAEEADQDRGYRGGRRALPLEDIF